MMAGACFVRFMIFFLLIITRISSLRRAKDKESNLIGCDTGDNKYGLIKECSIEFEGKFNMEMAKLSSDG